jgi:hypothetical protein
MKTLINSSLISFCFCLLALNGSSLNKKLKSDSSKCLEINGRLFNFSNGSDNIYKIELIETNTLVDSLILGNKGAFSFLLKKDLRYGIRISKNGSMISIINLITHKPEQDDKLDRFHFHVGFDGQEMKKLRGDDQNALMTVLSLKSKLKNYMVEKSGKTKKQLYAR